MDFIWIDAETTGLRPDKHDIVQLACIPVVKGQKQEHFNEFCQPLNFNDIEEGAVRAHGITPERMRTFQDPKVMIDKFITYLKKFNTKFIIAGYNVGFDKRFLSAFFTKHGRTEDFFALFELQVHDTFNRAKEVKSELSTENLKLATLAKHFKIDINAHEALSDISATIEVDKYIGKMLGEEVHAEDLAIDDAISVTDLSIDFPEPAQLHMHSMYSMVESVPSIEEWVDWCEKNNVPGFSVVDHGVATSLYHMIRLKSKTVTGVPGVGLYFHLDDEPDVLYPVNAWAVSNEGYFNLMKLASLASETQNEVDGISYPKLRLQDLCANKTGLMFGTADVYGPVGNAILEGDLVKANKRFQLYVDSFKDQMYVEFNPVSIKHTFSAKKGFQRIKTNNVVVDGDLNKAYNTFIASMVDKHRLKCIPVCGAHFIDKNDKLIQECISRNAYSSGKSYIESYHAKGAKQLYAELKSQLGDWLNEEMFRGWISNTLNIVEQAKTIKVSFNYHIPKIDIPEHIQAKTDDYNKQTLLHTIELCKAHGRWSDDPVYVERFKKEVDVIMKNDTLNFLPYFLLYEDICTYARSKGILQNIGRGSAGGCLLSYYLKIIHIDPIRANLPFERFLSHARIRAKSFPDIDCDFGDRTEIVEYLENKYGAGFAQICTLQKMKIKNAIKDAMFAMYGRNREDNEIKQLCELIPDSPQGVDEYDFIYGYTDKEDVYHQGLVEMVPEVARFFEQYKQVEDMVKRLIGIPRAMGRHASAFVISTLNLSCERIPTTKVMDKSTGRYIRVTQYEAPMIEASGLVKADILGVTTINMVSECIKLVKERTGIDYLEEDDKGVALIYRLPDEPNVYVDFYNRKTDSSFQFNTSLIKGYIQKFAPLSREHLSDLTALCRPGALDAPFINDKYSLDDGITAAEYYMKVRNGETISYLHPDLSTCTTNGIFVYQEEVMKFLVDIAGYTLEESDQIRGAIAKKKADIMMATFERIRKSTATRGWNKEQADIVCNQIQAFARYSFNRSHSRCYAELGYITMYLKHYHKSEWWSAVLNNTGDEDKLRHFITLLGDLISPPSVVTPVNKFTIVGNKIVSPMSAVKRVGPASVYELVAKGPFKDLNDYVERVTHNKVNKGHFAALVKARAFDTMMDTTIPYQEARIKFLEDYCKLRKVDKFTEELYETHPIQLFLMEREFNKCFNRTVAEDDAVIDQIILNKIPGVIKTNKQGIPLYLGQMPILAGYKMALGLAQKKYEKEVGMVMLYQGSMHKSGLSKKSKREYNFVKVDLSDGNSNVECMMWDHTKPLKWPINSLVFVKGKLQEGWGGKVQLTVREMEKIEDVKIRDSEGTTKNARK